MGSLGIILHRNIHRLLFTAVAISLLFATAQAQQSPAANTADRVALYQALLDLTNPWTVMCIAAHPDDEDGTSLVVMRRKYGAHTVSLFSTFGEGGQNAIGPELYEEMGAIRARETMAASEIQGSEPHFLGLKDFGFSKSADETFQKWGHEEALRRMVLQIRKLRPDVIITNHSVTSNDHGHHQATARLAVEAFDAAADPNRFPEQLKDGVTSWQVQRLFVRVRGSQTLPDNPVIVTIDPNEQDPVRGTTFAEQALSALQKHATQGPWPKSVAQLAARFANQSDGRLPLIRYRLARAAKDADPLSQEAPSFVSGLTLKDDSLVRLTSLLLSDPPLTTSENALVLVNDKDLFSKLNGLAKEFHKLTPTKITMPRNVYVREELMDERLNAAIAAAAGIKVDLAAESEALVPRIPGRFTISITNHGNKEARLYSVGLHGMAMGAIRPPDTPRVGPGQSVKVARLFEPPPTVMITVPHSEHLYDGRVMGEIFTAVVPVSVEGNTFQIIERKAFDVAPPIEIADISPSPLVIRTPQVGVSSAGVDILPATPPKVSLKLTNRLTRSFKGEVAFGFENRSPETRVRVDILPQQTTTLTVTIPNIEDNRAAHTRRPELANSLWFALRNADMHENLIKSSVPVVWLDARVARKVNVGYVRGFDFSLPNALDALGVDSKELSVEEVKSADLSRFSTVIVDNRVYESQPELIAANQKLLDFANNGGTLIVFYHKSDEWNPDPRRNRPQLAPYKLIVGNERVTDENAPITFLEPNHPLLNSPNKMAQEDFVDWIQERGVNYPREWDAQFHALLQSNDPGEAPLKGGLLVADYGKGRYIYSSMVWYRQLRAGVPGAYRMLANMISYGQESVR